LVPGIAFALTILYRRFDQGKPLYMSLPSVAQSPGPSVRAFDPERTAGSTATYASFGDFLAQARADAANPKRVGIGDFVDLLNPLQHIPLVGSLYRHVTGDTMKPGPMLMGGAVFGGGIGLMAASVNVAVQDETGAGIGETVLAQLDSPTGAVVQSPVQVARAEQTLVASYAGIFQDTDEGKDGPPVKTEGQMAAAQIAYFDPDRTAGGVVVYA
jgi:hypothetical protein